MALRLLADENIPGSLVDALRAAGNDVVWIRTDSPGAKDEEVLGRAREESRVLITFDKDFGELALRSRLSAGAGVVLLRLPIPDPVAIGEVVVNALSGRSDWVGHFSVIEADRIRMTPLPLRRPE